MPHRPNMLWQLWLVKSKLLDLEVNSSNGPKCTVLVLIKMRTFSFDHSWSHPPSTYFAGLNSRNQGNILSPSLSVSFEVEGVKMRIEESDGVSASRKHLVFAYYVTGHGFGHATRVVEVSFTALIFSPNCNSSWFSIFCSFFLYI